MCSIFSVVTVSLESKSEVLLTWDCTMTLKEKAFEESPQAKKMLERANFLANDLLEKANVKADSSS